jgi:glycerol uptake facilitator-like aquaporin
MVMGLLSWSDIWVYLLANFLGGVTAAIVFLYTQPAEKIGGDIRAAEADDIVD